MTDRDDGDDGTDDALVTFFKASSRARVARRV